MRLMFVHYVLPDRGSAQDMHQYVRAAEALGHEVVLYGRPQFPSPFRYSGDVEGVDAVAYIFEWTNDLQYGDQVDLVRLVERVPRNRRVVIDCDGRYNDAIQVTGDTNHPDPEASRRWIEVCDSLSDTILQPTYHPQKPNVRPFFVHAYNPAWERPLSFGHQEFGLCYVGNNWFRWRPLERILRAIEPVRQKVGRVAVVGQGWGSPAPWASPTITRDAYVTDPAYLESLEVEVLPPVRFDQVIETMGRALITPVIYRPLFDHLRLVTCRTFETPAAATIPLLTQDPADVTEIYGERARELILPEHDPEDKVLDMLERPEHYAQVVADIRRQLGERFSYEARLRELIEIVGG